MTDYFDAISNLTNFLPKSGTWPIDVVHHFVTHLSQTIQDGLLDKNYNYNTTTSYKLAYNQILGLQQVFFIRIALRKTE